MQNVNVQKNCPLCGAYGKSIAGIAASQTSTGSFSGSGIGIGGDGLMYGAVNGTKHSKSALAEKFEAPASTARHPASGLITGAIVCAVAAFLYAQFGDMFLSILSDGAAPIADDGGMADRIDSMAHIAMIFAPIAFVLAGGFKLWMAHKASSSEAEQKRYQREMQRDQMRNQIYYRLRYCEADHAVFDPETQQHAPAEPSHIQTLLNDSVSRVLPAT